MRIMKDGAKRSLFPDSDNVYQGYFRASDTIEITDEEWDTIFGRYLEQCFKMAGYNLANTLLITATMPFSEYLKALISLKVNP